MPVRQRLSWHCQWRHLVHCQLEYLGLRRLSAQRRIQLAKLTLSDSAMGNLVLRPALGQIPRQQGADISRRVALQPIIEVTNGIS
ncbi:hypothetical protein BC834DRAFT_879990 [Gloeopeniophorella convolvens]|nr:hypothetical protein BC834DRAFT_879990 [Gloeopeniophorella convolvens]